MTDYTKDRFSYQVHGIDGESLTLIFSITDSNGVIESWELTLSNLDEALQFDYLPANFYEIARQIVRQGVKTSK